MFLRILQKSFTRALKEKLLIILTVAFGASLASGMLNVALDVGDKLNQELKSYGANMQIVPKMDTIPVEIDGVNVNPLGKQAFLQEQDLLSLKKIFWANNILGFTPYLEASGQVEGKQGTVPIVGTWFTKELKLADGNLFTTGITQLKTWWKVTGKWPSENPDSREVILGKQIAGELKVGPGDELALQVKADKGAIPYHVKVVGVADAGGPEDGMIFAPIAKIQSLLTLPGKISRAEVSALTVPDNELASKVGTDPSSLREKDFDQWYCTAFTGAIAYQIEESIPGAQAKPIRQIAQSEGQILNKIQLLMLIISLAAVLSSALGISSLMNNKVQERKKEIALMKALGGTDVSVTALFMAEGVISGFLGGLIGYGLGLILAQIVGESVFGTALSIKLLGLPVILLLSVVITLAGSYPAIRAIIKLEPVQALYGR